MTSDPFTIGARTAEVLAAELPEDHGFVLIVYRRDGVDAGESGHAFASDTVAVTDTAIANYQRRRSQE